jgi:hypothetical protein
VERSGVWKKFNGWNKHFYHTPLLSTPFKTLEVNVIPNEAKPELAKV